VAYDDTGVHDSRTDGARQESGLLVWGVGSGRACQMTRTVSVAAAGVPCCAQRARAMLSPGMIPCRGYARGRSSGVEQGPFKPRVRGSNPRGLTGFPIVWVSFSSLAHFPRKSWMISVGKGLRVETVRIYRLSNLPRPLKQRLDQAQQEAARVWTMCRDLHREAREQALPWPVRDDLQRATKGQFALHSQTVQMICHRFLTSVEITRKLRRQNLRVRYPYRNKRFATLCWPAQAVSVEHGRVVLPMGRGRQSLVLRVSVPENSGACQLIWNDGYELQKRDQKAPAFKRGMNGPRFDKRVF
jgi:hypothetical protein